MAHDDRARRRHGEPTAEELAIGPAVVRPADAEKRAVHRETVRARGQFPAEQGERAALDRRRQPPRPRAGRRIDSPDLRADAPAKLENDIANDGQGLHMMVPVDEIRHAAECGLQAVELAHRLGFDLVAVEAAGEGERQQTGRRRQFAARRQTRHRPERRVTGERQVQPDRDLAAESAKCRQIRVELRKQDDGAGRVEPPARRQLADRRGDAGRKSVVVGADANGRGAAGHAVRVRERSPALSSHFASGNLHYTVRKTLGKVVGDNAEARPGRARLAIVVPFYDEAAVAAALLDRIVRVLEELDRTTGIDWQILCVNDGSRDATLEALVGAHRRESRIRILDLSRNFGKECALTAGLERTDADAVVTMDGDGQHPPELVPAMLEKWREGFEVVYMVREERGITGFHRTLRAVFYWLFALASPTKLTPESGDFRLMDRRVVRAVVSLPERTRFMKGIYSWVGFRQTGLPYREAPRVNGNSRWNLLALTRFAMDALSAFSTLPLRLWSWIGAVVAGLSLLYGLWRMLRAVFWGIDVPGFETLVVSITFLGGVQLLSLGVIGGYIGRIFDEVKGRPLYVVRQTYGFPDDEAR